MNRIYRVVTNQSGNRVAVSELGVARRQSGSSAGLILITIAMLGMGLAFSAMNAQAQQVIVNDGQTVDYSVSTFSLPQLSLITFNGDAATDGSDPTRVAFQGPGNYVFDGLNQNWPMIQRIEIAANGAGGFVIDSGATVTLKNGNALYLPGSMLYGNSGSLFTTSGDGLLVVTNNGGGYGPLYTLGSLSLGNVELTNNSANNVGGAVYAAGNVDFTGTAKLTGNYAGAVGGAVYAGGNVHFSSTSADVEISGNSGSWRSFASGIYSGGTMTFDGGAHIANNTAGQGDSTWPGGSSVAAAGDIIFTNTGKTIVIENNQAINAGVGSGLYAGGNIRFAGNAEVTGNGSTSGTNSGGAIVAQGDVDFGGEAVITNNAANYQGGALYSNGAVSFAGNAKISNNTSASGASGISLGGGVYAANGITFNSAGSQIIINDNHAGNEGGGLYVLNNGVTVNGNAEVSGNTSAQGSGAGVYAQNGDIRFNGAQTSLLNNTTAMTSTKGGALAANNGDVDIVGDLTLTGNQAGSGGGIYASGWVTVGGAAQISQNSGINGGAMMASGIRFTDASQTVVLDSNTASGGYGGALNGSGRVYFQGGASIVNNVADLGGAIYGGEVGFTNVDAQLKLDNNRATAWYSSGGAIYSTGDVFVMSGGSISGNQSLTGGGGAIYAAGALYLNTGSAMTIADNSTTGYGGAIYVNGDLAQVNAGGGDITFRGNKNLGAATGNAIYLAGNGTTLELGANSGHTLAFYDPITQYLGNGPITVKINQSGLGGTVLFSGVDYAADQISRQTALNAQTTLSGGVLELAGNAEYGAAGYNGSSFNAVAGTLRSSAAGSSNILNASSIDFADNTGISLRDGSTLNLAADNAVTSGNAAWDGNGTLLSSHGVTFGNAKTLTANIAGGDEFIVDTVVSGTNAQLIKNDAGTLTLQQAAAYTGGTQVNAGTLKAGVADVIRQSNALNIGATGIFDLDSNSQTVSELSGVSGAQITFGNQPATVFTASNTGNTQYNGTISGDGSLIKSGAGSLTLSGVDTYTGTTHVQNGSLILANAQAASAQQVDVDSGAHLGLAFSNAAFNNPINGAGTVDVTGTQIALGGTNTLSGLWHVTGSASVAAPANLGSAVVNLDGSASSLTAAPVAAGGFTFANQLTGNGTLFARMAQPADAFAFTSGVGSAFTGTFAMGQGAFALSGVNTATLQQATLRADSGSTTTVGAGSQSIGGLTFNGGKVAFDATIPAQVVANGSISAQRLDLNGTGSVAIHLPALPGTPELPTAGNTNLLSQDDGTLVKLASGNSVVGAGGALTLVDDTDQLISDAQQVAIADGAQTVATGTYDYRLNSGTANDGLYVGYALKQVDILAGKTLTLTPDAGATGMATDLSAILSGSGNLTVAAGVGQTVSLTNSINSYTGKTTAASGTLKLGSNNALGQTSQLDVAAGAAVEMNGMNQTVGKLTTATGAQLDLSGTLTISDAQRTVGDTDGGLVESNTLRGNGTLVIDPSVVQFNGANNGFTGNVTLTGGAQAIANDVQALGDSGTVDLTGVDDTLTLGELPSQPGVLPTGALRKQITGQGVVALQSGADITLKGDNSTFAGQFTIDSDATLRADAASQLGSAAVTDHGVLALAADSNWQLNNAVTGNGRVVKQGNAVLAVDQALAGFTGQTNVQAGTLRVGADGQPSARVGGAVNVDAGALLTGRGTVVGAVNNAGTIAALNTVDTAASAGNFTVGALSGSGVIDLAGRTIGNTLTVSGNYHGDQATLKLNTQLGGDLSPTDRLLIGGDSSGQTTLQVNNDGGNGERTLGDGIQVVRVGGASNGQFRLGSRLIAGLYEYDLYQGGKGANANDGNWYLRTLGGSDNDGGNGGGSVRPETGVYLRNMSAASLMFVHTLHDRLGQQQPANAQDAGASAWVRVVGNHTNSQAAGGQIDMSSDTALVHFGGDLAGGSSNGSDRWQVGLMGAYGYSRTDADPTEYKVTPSGYSRTANGKVDGYGVGAYATWYGDQSKASGPYVDLWIMYGWYNNSVRGNTLPEEKYRSDSWAVSAETGYAFVAHDGDSRQWLIEPQAQIAYNSYHADDHQESNGTWVRNGDNDGVLARAGVRFFTRSKLDGNAIQPFVEANWWYGSANNDLAFNGRIVSDGTPDSRFELKAGLQGEIAKNWQVWGHVGGQWGANNYNRYEGMLGIRHTF